MKYIDTPAIKSLIDLVQSTLMCCGNKAYSDWFNIGWIPKAYINLDDPDIKSHMTMNVYMGQNVPWSCCNPRAPRPCINTDVVTDSMHVRYDHLKEVTLHKEGL